MNYVDFTILELSLQILCWLHYHRTDRTIIADTVFDFIISELSLQILYWLHYLRTDRTISIDIVLTSLSQNYQCRYCVHCLRTTSADIVFTVSELSLQIFHSSISTDIMLTSLSQNYQNRYYVDFTADLSTWLLAKPFVTILELLSLKIWQPNLVKRLCYIISRF